MFRKVGIRDSRYLAKLVTGDRAPCAFCHRDVDDEVTFGKLYAIGDIQCHYLCALLSCCLVQKGPEEEGLFGFMYKDIKAELERSKKHKCSYCGCGGANLGCSVSSCRKQFHLPCGRERNAVSLFYGSYKSFCEAHAPKQRIPDHIMYKAKLRMKDDKKKISSKDDASQSLEEGMVCVICYEAVDAFPTVNTFWPPCCGKDAWFHRNCLQRMALSAGMHYLKCPLCNDKKIFYEAVENQGYYVPDRDAAWELEQNAFAEIYERPLTCTAELCKCPDGRSHDADQGMWDIKLCLLCGSIGAHAQCIGASETTRYVCLTCTPAAPHDLQALAETIEKLIVEEQVNSTAVRLGPVMPSRMSLRRTKGRLPMLNKPSTSREHRVKTEFASPAPSPSTESSRQELNLRTPRRLVTTEPYNTQSSPCFRTSPRKSIHTTCSNSSPIKLSEQISNESYKNADAKQSPMKTHNTDPYKNKDSYKNSDAKNSPIKLQNADSYKNLDTKQSPMKLPQNSDSYKNTDSYKNIESRLLSPMKLLEQSFKDKVVCMGGNAILDDQVDILRRRFNKPRPMCKKKKIIDDILNGLFDDFDSQLKQKDPVREWCSPRKCMSEQEGIETASDNRTKTVGNTVENEENCIHETPQKPKRVDLSLSIKVSIPRLKDTQLKDIATLCDEKQVDGDNHNEVLENNNEIKENNSKIVEKHNEIEQSHSGVGENQINAGNHKTKEIKAMNECHREDNNQIDAGSHNKIEEIKAINNESLNSAVQLHSEFIAEPQSDENIKLESPNRKTIEIKDTSLEISEQNHSVNINVIKINENVNSHANNEKSPYKFNKLDTDNLGEGILGLDLETFKNSYLREVDANYKCSFNHKHDINPPLTNFRTVIDFAIDAHSRKDNVPRKRKLSQSSLVLSFDKTQPKKRKMSEDFNSSFSSDDFEIKKDFTVTNKVDTDKVTDKHKTDAKDKRNERESRKRRHDKKQKVKRGQRSNKDKLRTENRNLLDRKLESKTEKRREKRIKSNHENTVKDRDIKKIDVKDKTELKDKQNIDNSKRESKETCKDKRVKPSGTKDYTKQQENIADKKTKSKDKKNKEQRNGTTELNKTKPNENKKQKDKRKIHLKSSRREEKRAKDKTRDSKDGRVKYKSRSNDERTRKDKVIDEKTNSRKERKNKLDHKTNSHNEKHKETDKYKIIKHDSDKRVKDRKPKDRQNIEVTIDSSKRKSDNKSKTRLSITNSEKDNISVKIKWKKKLLSLKIKSKKEKTEKVEKDNSKFKQYVLQYFSEVTPRDVLVKPEKEVSPLKRKYVKQEKTPDNLKQMSIQNFFKVKSD